MICGNCRTRIPKFVRQPKATESTSHRADSAPDAGVDGELAQRGVAVSKHQGLPAGYRRGHLHKVLVSPRTVPKDSTLARSFLVELKPEVELPDSRSSRIGPTSPDRMNHPCETRGVKRTTRSRKRRRVICRRLYSTTEYALGEPLRRRRVEMKR